MAIGVTTVLVSGGGKFGGSGACVSVTWSCPGGLVERCARDTWRRQTGSAHTHASPPPPPPQERRILWVEPVSSVRHRRWCTTVRQRTRARLCPVRRPSWSSVKCVFVRYRRTHNFLFCRFCHENVFWRKTIPPVTQIIRLCVFV